MARFPGRLARCLAAGVLAALASAARAQEAAPPAAAELKELSVEELMEIEVTSVSRRSEQLSRAAAAILVLTQEDIRRSGVTSLAEALRLVNSLQVARVTSRSWAISARGFNLVAANKLLVLIDGRSIYTPLFSGVFWDVQDYLLEDVERIEVIRGPGAAIWGANAVNGVINIITQRAGATQGGLLVGGGGGEERSFGALRYGGTVGERGRYRAYAKYFDRDALTFARGDSARDPMEFTQGGFRTDWQSSERDAFTLQGDAYDGRIGDAILPDVDVDGGNLLGRWSRRLSEASDFELQVYWDRTHRRVPLQFEEDRDTWDLDFRHRLPVGTRHEVVWGAGYRGTRDEVADSVAVRFEPDRRTSELASLFVQDEIKLLEDRLRLTFGSKLEHNDFTGFEVQPSVRFSWLPAVEQTLWGAVSRAIRMPTRLDDDLRLTAGSQVLIRGDRGFESEELIAYELGYRTQPRPDLSVEVATFYNVYDELRSQERPPGGGFPVVLANKLEGETYGLEVFARLQATERWRLLAGYSYLEKDLRLEPGSTDVTGGRDEGNDPRHRFTLRSLLDLPGGVELDAWLRHVDRLPDPFVPGYTELNLRLGWRLSEALDLSLVGENLLHEHHPEFGPPLPTREEVDRSVHGKVTWRF